MIGLKHLTDNYRYVSRGGKNYAEAITAGGGLPTCVDFCNRIFTSNIGNPSLGFYYAKCYDWGDLSNSETLGNDAAGVAIPSPGNDLADCLRTLSPL